MEKEEGGRRGREREREGWEWSVKGEEEKRGREGKGRKRWNWRGGEGKTVGTRLPFFIIITCECIKFYYSLLSPVPLPPSPESMAPSRAVRMKRSTSSDVNFILDWPVTRGRRDREALILPIATRHCCALIGI